ncbi:hypothetical protein CYMTET_35483 [Cymbomonas tetramitiformis]|uniref:Uncharacterized protein n=1 Tax=Cymbomonas tetramitiformis TaxID=36881 RepID=A0AAE0F969_9CHLO|nr:hypothetical protein CYMTET_35483 [Cymbomonas tetramitiformis]
MGESQGQIAASSPKKAKARPLSAPSFRYSFESRRGETSLASGLKEVERDSRWKSTSVVSPQQLKASVERLSG